ncbi:hypothetical protein KXD97_29800 [Mycobacterium sp. SMC-8]|uniref:hypothetical protein n=1 Tax=Mycobacterium sp. SMC-8 TaxID=2857060 RepID=UPI0021B28CAE|nr:hypothetical protein [Mycobacterium sp. SMC-8]UXA12066.1 hypothetical protein KXD97_29800 [Mycobacterium sp. SMC-8]
MAAYRMTPARRAALEKAQAASARKRRKLHNRSRLSRNAKVAIGVGAVTTTAVAGVVAVNEISDYQAEQRLVSGPLNRIIIDRHVSLAREHNARLNRLKLMGIPPWSPKPFDEASARREAINILRRKKKKT